MLWIILGGVLLVIIILITILYLRLPHIFAKKMRTPLDNSNNAAQCPVNFDSYKEKVEAIKNLNYPSQYPSNLFDLYLPKNQERVPIILWIHGGGFIAGTKDGTENLMTMLSASGYAVISMDYAVAPEHKYPTATLQAVQMLNFIPSLLTTYKSLDISKIFLGGDSAGGHICAQLATLCTNADYQKQLSAQLSIDCSAILGVILCSAPLDIENMLPKKNFQLKLMSKVFSNGYFGLGKKRQRIYKKQACIKSNVTKNFPKTFISDGNTMSFEQQNRDFAATLKNYGISVTELYWDKQQHGVINHEYMFELSQQPAYVCYQQIVNFLSTSINL